MDAYEATRVVFSRIQSLDPDNAAKIMGLLLIQDNSEKEMIRLAFGPETLLHTVILKAKKDLGLLIPSVSASASASPTPFHHHHQLSRQNSSSSSSRFAMPPPPPLTITSPSWAPPPPDAVQCSSEDLMLSPNSAASAAASPFYGGELVDEPYLGWKPCLYFARGFCKNGATCKFLHDDGGSSSSSSSSKLDMALEQELLLRAKSQRLSSPTAAFPYSPTGASLSPMSMSMPISPSSAKCMNIFLQQQNESQRTAAAAAAAALMLGGDEGHKFMGRSRFDRSDFLGMMNPGSRQIYLTFPADSTFREEDVSNYFSIYGPVQDVRIPYQQKRMFGFVTFVYPDTVKLILAKGNPHFVCDARVLVKPYKEKGKVPDKKQQQQQGEMRGDFSGCTTPTSLDGRDPYELQQLGARMMYNSCSSSQEMYLRRKFEEQQQAAELQQAIELQGRRFMGLQLLDFNNNNNNNRSMPFSPISTPTTITTTPSNDRSHEESSTEEKSLSPASNGGEKQAMAVNSAIAIAADKEESAERDGSPNEDSDFQGSVEHNLPDSPFASPTKGAGHPFADGTVAVESEFVAGSSPLGNGNGNQLISSTSTLMPQNSSLDMASLNSCFFQMSRFSSGHGAVGLYK